MLSTIRALALTILCACPGLAVAQDADAPVQQLLQTHADTVAKSSRRTIGPAIDALANSGLPAAQTVLERWQVKEMWRDKESGLFVFGTEIDRDTILVMDIADGSEIGPRPDKAFKQLKPNSGVRGMIGAALVQFQLSAPNIETRRGALDAIERDAEPSHLTALRASIESETDPALKARKERMEGLLTIRFGDSDAKRIAAIERFSNDLGVDLRAALTPLTQTKINFSETAPDETATILQPGTDVLPRDIAYDLLVAADRAPARIGTEDRVATLVANIVDGKVAGYDVASLNTDKARDAAYAALVDSGAGVATPTDSEIDAALAAHVFFTQFTGAPPQVAQAALTALQDIEAQLALNQTFDLALDAMSLASIYFLAAFGLAITFGVMRVINMAHGEFIMMGAYTGYVVQLVIPDYTVSILVALPVAFIVTFSAGVAMERLLIRFIAHRPLETLLATFGVSIALQQLAKNIFGTQARPLTSPGWLDGSLILNDVVQISYIRIAIFVLALIFLALFLVVMNRTRLGLEVRAVTQNPRMAASMGINPARINMLTFGFGSGIAGIAGVAIGLYAKVTSEMGADYIVQSFMTVVVGGVGNIWGTLLGATLVGTMQKGIEWIYPSNTLAAQTYMILFIILFIQFRPRGIIALKGRAAEA